MGRTESDTTCPTCGRDFKTERGMKCHHTAIHDQSISGILVSCDWCGSEHRKKRATADRNEYNYCSDECERKHRSKRFSGPGNPQYKGGKVEVNCYNCGSKIERFQSAIEDTEHHFCSRDCYIKSQSEIIPSGQSHPYFKKKVSKECSDCGETFKVHQSRKDTANYCSWECRRNALIERNKRLSGSDSPHWKGGHPGSYGASWKRQRKKALERDSRECAICGKSKEELGKKLHVHHKTPFRKYGLENHEKANELSNLITLCSDCHVFWEKIPVQPEVVT